MRMESQQSVAVAAYQRRKEKNRKIFLLVLACAIAAGVVVSVVLWRNTTRQDPNATPAVSGKMSGEEIANQLQSQVDAGVFSCEMNPAPMFATAQSKGLLAIRNGPSNGLNMRVRITRNDTGEVLYTSPVLRPGEQIAEDVLTAALSPGEYPATALVEALSPEDDGVAATLNMALTVTVKE
ncbi:MAG: hypothetical protein RSC76_09365 [Oscillospiraceae bacterium]